MALLRAAPGVHQAVLPSCLSSPLHLPLHPLLTCSSLQAASATPAASAASWLASSVSRPKRSSAPLQVEGRVQHAMLVQTAARPVPCGTSCLVAWHVPGRQGGPDARLRRQAAPEGGAHRRQAQLHALLGGRLGERAPQSLHGQACGGGLGAGHVLGSSPRGATVFSGRGSAANFPARQPHHTVLTIWGQSDLLNSRRGEGLHPAVLVGAPLGLPHACSVIGQSARCNGQARRLA